MEDSPCLPLMMEITLRPLQPPKAYLCFPSVLPLIHMEYPPSKWKKVGAVPVSRRGKTPPPQVCPMWLWPVFISRPSRPCGPHAASEAVTPVPWGGAGRGRVSPVARVQPEIPFCPSPAVCDLALLSYALSEDRCPLGRGADPTGGCKWVEMSRCPIPKCSAQEVTVVIISLFKLYFH